MNERIRLLIFLGLAGTLFLGAARSQDAPTASPGTGAPQPRQRGEGREGGPRLFGKIAAVHDNSLEVTGPNGQVVIVKVSAQTEMRKNGEAAKLSDFKVGDMVVVGGDENADHSFTAKRIGARTGGMSPGAGGGMFMASGTLGKDYVVGEVKSIDAPRLTLVRTDNVTQTLELNEETSMRRGRESITMADIQAGDHLMAGGAVQNDVFVPKNLVVMSAEQWKRLKEFAAQAQGNATKPSGPETPAAKP